MPSSVDAGIARWTSSARSLIFRKRTSPDAEIVSMTHSPWPAAFSASRNGLIGYLFWRACFATKMPASEQRNLTPLCLPRQQSRKKFHQRNVCERSIGRSREARCLTCSHSRSMNGGGIATVRLQRLISAVRSECADVYKERRISAYELPSDRMW